MYHPYCHSPSALTEYLKQKLRAQRAKRLGRSLPAQVERNVQLEHNSNVTFGLHLLRRYIGLLRFFPLASPLTPKPMYDTIWRCALVFSCTIQSGGALSCSLVRYDLEESFVRYQSQSHDYYDT